MSTLQVPCFTREVNDKFAFIKLFETVGERLTRDFFEKAGWMYSRQWTTEERNGFVKGLANDLMNRKIYATNKEAEKAACFFVHHYGWQINDNPQHKTFE